MNEFNPILDHLDPGHPAFLDSLCGSKNVDPLYGSENVRTTSEWVYRGEQDTIGNMSGHYILPYNPNQGNYLPYNPNQDNYTVPKITKGYTTGTSLVVGMTSACIVSMDLKASLEKQLTPTKVIFSGNCCISFFPDGKKIIVRKNEEDEFDEYTAVAYCIIKYIFESNSHYKKTIDKAIKVRKYSKGDINEQK